MHLRAWTPYEQNTVHVLPKTSVDSMPGRQGDTNEHLCLIMAQPGERDHVPMRCIIRKQSYTVLHRMSVSDIGWATGVSQIPPHVQIVIAWWTPVVVQIFVGQHWRGTSRWFTT